MGRKSRREKNRKPRSEHIYATTTGEVSEIAVTVDGRTGAISFGQEMTNVYSERSYERPKGPKVLSRIPQTEHHAYFDDEDALAVHFDRIFAVDTNTRTVHGRRLSVVGVTVVKREVIPAPLRLQTSWRFDVPFAIEYGNLDAKPEPFGWMGALEILKKWNFYAEGMRVALIVDSELGLLKDFNSRKAPVDNGEYLPAGVTLVYASTDAGKETLVNQALSISDTASGRILDAVEAGSLPMNSTPSGVALFATFRVIHVNSIDGSKVTRL